MVVFSSEMGNFHGYISVDTDGSVFEDYSVGDDSF